MGIVTKIVGWVKMVLPPILGFVEVGLKFLKEVLTLVATILYPIIPSASFQGVVDKIRGYVNTIYGYVSAYKDSLIKWAGV